ncbi:MAG: diphthine synthase [Haloquadratum sp. J07HQX50]|jgi:diphthine synthase|nr:MAG: diphthine synthase [Haloquadratum sp. J07HQX50]
MLSFVGLGLYDTESITLQGKRAIEEADHVFAEFYTSRLLDANADILEQFYEITIDICGRAEVEQDPTAILDAAETGEAAFLTAGDTMISTTHTDLRLRAMERGIETRIIHGVTAQTAASGLTGLQNYRFGKSVTLPFPESHGTTGVPPSVCDSIDANRSRGLHTLVYLDIKAAQNKYMTATTAATLLADSIEDTLGVVVARAGSPSPTVAAERLSTLASIEFGDPLHLVVIPASLHHLEADALSALTNASSQLIDDYRE